MVGALLYAALKQHGITVRGGIAKANTPANAAVLASKTSAPLSELAVTFLKLSNNSYGEILTKAMGWGVRRREKVTGNPGCKPSISICKSRESIPRRCGRLMVQGC